MAVAQNALANVNYYVTQGLNHIVKPTVAASGLSALVAIALNPINKIPTLLPGPAALTAALVVLPLAIVDRVIQNVWANPDGSQSFNCKMARIVGAFLTAAASLYVAHIIVPVAFTAHLAVTAGVSSGLYAIYLLLQKLPAHPIAPPRSDLVVGSRLDPAT